MKRGLLISVSKVILIVWSSFVVCLSSCKRSEADTTGQPVNPNNPDPAPEATDLFYIFKEKTEGYSCFRIPAIIKTQSGTLLAFAEARKLSCKDEGDIDLVVKRSVDGGKTWGKMQTIWDDNGNTCGNPAPVVDRKTGKIHLLMTWNLGEDGIGSINNGTSKDTRRVFATQSSDDGLTWVSPKEITSSVKKAGWGWYATGPCHGIQIGKGKYEGRLVIPCDFIEIGLGRRGYSHLIYSDDSGATWEIGGISPEPNVNESTVAELSDGALMLNMRSSSSPRRVAISRDGGSTFTDMRADFALIEPVCQGSILSGVINKMHTVFFSNPASSTRKNMTIKMSTNDGNSWSKTYPVYSGPSAYSDIALIDDTKIAILFEAGPLKSYQGIAFATVPVSKFK